MLSRKHAIYALSAALLAGAAPASAAIIGGNVTGGTSGGVFELLTPPLSDANGLNQVGNNNFQNPNLFGFDEDQNIVLTAPLTVDTPARVLPAGTTVASHYIFFDPAGIRRTIGTVDFNSNVLAIISSADNLLASDFLANTGVTYLNPAARGIEGNDSATISGPRQVSVDFRAGNPGDFIRVLTEFSPPITPIPEPATLAIFGLGIAGLGVMSRRRRQRLQG